MPVVFTRRYSTNVTLRHPDAVATARPADSPEIAALAGHVRAGRCALFVGAGLSAPAGLPTWGTLVDRMIEETTPWAVDPALLARQITLLEPPAAAQRQPDVNAIRDAVGRAQFTALCRRLQRARGGDLRLEVLGEALQVVYADSLERRELRRLAEAKRFTELAGHCRDRLGRERFHDFVRRSVAAQDGIPRTHRHIVRTPFSCVITTNFDTLLEDAYTRWGTRGVPRAPTGAELGQHGTLLFDHTFFVLKAHGDAARPETMIFTADDYRRVIHASPAFQAILGAILLTQAVLFVGYSLNDTNFRLLLDNQLTVFNGNVPPRYALLSGVGAAERDILWRTAKLEVLSYPEGQHEEVGRCLAALADQSAARGAPAPRPSARPADPGPAAREPGATLAIDGDGDRLQFTLVRRGGGDAETVWVGAARHPDTRAMGVWIRAADQASMLGRPPLPDIRRVGAQLARALPSPLRSALGRLPERELVEIACSSAATRIPWEWLQVAGQVLALRHAVVRRPVDVTHRARGRPAVGRRLRALVLGDAGFATGQVESPLPYADWEAETVERLLHAGAPDAVVTRLPAERATHDRVASLLERNDYDLIHFGGHAWFDEREAYFYLWDRVMLGSALASLLSRCPPALMVLNTHYTAFVLAESDVGGQEIAGAPPQPTAAPPAGGARGFAAAAMRGGVASFVGSFGEIGDRPAAEFAAAFYAGVMGGATVAEALRAARRATARAVFDTGLFYTVFGYPDFRLVRADARARRAVARALADARAGANRPARRRS